MTSELRIQLLVFRTKPLDAKISKTFSRVTASIISKKLKKLAEKSRGWREQHTLSVGVNLASSSRGAWCHTPLPLVASYIV